MESDATVFQRTIFAILSAALVVSCARAGSSDAAGPAAPGRRIVSLMPSLTEDLIAVGARDQIVAIDKFSADVPGAQNIPEVADVSSIDAERIVALHPDVVVGIPSQERVLEPLRRAGISVVLFRDDSFEDIFSNLDGLGVLSGHLAQARTLKASLEARTRQLHRSVRFKRTPSVFVVLDTSPIYTAGKPSYIASLIRLAGGRNAADNLSAPFAQYGAEALLRAQPDAIVSDANTPLRGALRAEPWRSLHAVQRNHVFIISNADLLERPGPRYNEGLAWLIGRLQTLDK